MVCRRCETRVGILPGPTVFNLRSPCKENLGVRILMSKPFLFERMAFLLFRLSIRLELPEPCSFLLKPDCSSLALQSSWESPYHSFVGKNLGPLFQFTAYQLPSADLDFPASALDSPNNFLWLEVLFTAYLHSLWTINTVGPSGPVMLH